MSGRRGCARYALGLKPPAASLDPLGDRGPRRRARHRGPYGAQRRNPAACGGFAASHLSQRHVEPAARPIIPPATREAAPRTLAGRPSTGACRTPWGVVSRPRTRPSRIVLEIVRRCSPRAPRTLPPQGAPGSRHRWIRPVRGDERQIEAVSRHACVAPSPRPSPAPKRTASRRTTSHGLADPMIERFGIHEPCRRSRGHGSGRYRVEARRSPSSRATVSTSTTSSAVVRKFVKHTRR